MITLFWIISWIIIGIIFGLVLLRFPIYIWVSAAVLAAATSRVFVWLGIVPSFMNFFHFPLVLAAVIVASMKGESHAPVSRAVKNSLVGLLIVSYVSWIPNGGEYFRPFFTWLVFCEFFLIIYVVLRMPPREKQIEFLWKLILTIAFIQFLFALVQKPTGLLSPYPAWSGDVVQGTFPGMGNGTHAAGAAAMLGMLICIARGLAGNTPRQRLYWFGCSILLFVVPILADAKQVIAAFIPAVLFLFFASGKLAAVRKVAILIFLTFFLVASMIYNVQVQNIFTFITNRDLLTKSITGKITGLKLIINEMKSIGIGSWFLGIGPGNSISRVGLMAYYARPNSPIRLLGLGESPVTMRIWLLGGRGSGGSAWTGVSSWLGVFGDWGLVGLGIYTWMFWILWRNLKRKEKWEVVAAKAVLVMTIILGFVYSWLEEPGYILIVGLIVGLGLVANRENERISTEHEL